LLGPLFPAPFEPGNPRAGATSLGLGFTLQQLFTSNLAFRKDQIFGNGIISILLLGMNTQSIPPKVRWSSCKLGFWVCHTQVPRMGRAPLSSLKPSSAPKICP